VTLRIRITAQVAPIAQAAAQVAPMAQAAAQVTPIAQVVIIAEVAVKMTMESYRSGQGHFFRIKTVG